MQQFTSYIFGYPQGVEKQEKLQPFLTWCNNMTFHSLAEAMAYLKEKMEKDKK